MPAEIDKKFRKIADGLSLLGLELGRTTFRALRGDTLMFPTYNSDDPIKAISEYVEFRREQLESRARRFGFLQSVVATVIVMTVYAAMLFWAYAQDTKDKEGPFGIGWFGWVVIVVATLIALAGLYLWVNRKSRSVGDEIASEYFDLATTQASTKDLRQHANEATGQARIVTALKDIQLHDRLAGLRRRMRIARRFYLGSYGVALAAALVYVAVILPYFLIEVFPPLYDSVRNAQSAMIGGSGADVQHMMRSSAILIAWVLLPPVATLLILSSTFWWRARLNAHRNDTQQTELEIDLNRFTPNESEKRAEHLLRVNQVELRRYYDINVNQNRQVFRVGVLLIVIGLGLSLITILGAEGGSVNTAGIVAAGAAILSNFVAAMFLRMHAASAAAMTQFHGRLVETDRLYLAHVIASRLVEPRRETTLAALALAIARTKPDSGGEAPAKPKPRAKRAAARNTDEV